MATDEAVQQAAELALHEARSGELHIVVGTGRAATACWHRIFALCTSFQTHVHAYPTSIDSRLLLLASTRNVLPSRPPLTLHTLEELATPFSSGTRLHVVLVDGYDAACRQSATLVKGGGAAHFAEKLGMLLAQTCIFVGTPAKVHATDAEMAAAVAVPLEVVPSAAMYVLERVSTDIAYASAVLRVAKSDKAGPVVTDNGNFVVDVRLPRDFPLPDADRILSAIHGVVSTGLFFPRSDQRLVIL